jgi:hypothetical protein
MYAFNQAHKITKLILGHALNLNDANNFIPQETWATNFYLILLIIVVML